MGDISIIARRLKDGHVQYGWSGNGGYYQHLGIRLLAWYDDPELVEYLFSLGELKLVGKPGSEKGGESWFVTHMTTGSPHNLGKSERSIFSQIAFIDYGYFYDLDNIWYYVVPGPFRIKFPLELLYNILDKDENEFDYLREIQQNLIRYILGEYRAQHPEFSRFLRDNNFHAAQVEQELLKEEFCMYKLFKSYQKVHGYFDDWVLCLTDDARKNITGFKMRKKEEVHVETNEW